MYWLSGALLLVVVGLVLRRLLRLNGSLSRPPEAPSWLTAERESIYLHVTREVETQTAMLAVSLNDAFQERAADHHEIACRLVSLSVSEWARLAEVVQALLNIITKYIAQIDGLVLHSIRSQRFKSPPLIDDVRLHELLVQFVFRSRLRCQLQVRLLRRATETLTSEFRRICEYLDQTRDDSAEVWQCLDIYFHDFDLIIKETLLALHALLASMPRSLAAELNHALQIAVERGVRSSSSR